MSPATEADAREPAVLGARRGWPLKRRLTEPDSYGALLILVLSAVGSVLTNKYAEGYPGRRYYGGCEFVDQAETLAIERAKALFGVEHVNVQPHSGANANLAAYLALMNPGDKILGAPGTAEEEPPKVAPPGVARGRATREKKL